MITLQFLRLCRPGALEKGKVIHLKIIKREVKSPGRWHFLVDDVTPLPGAVIQYFCLCGLGEEALPDGSLPPSWTLKQTVRGVGALCSNCKDTQFCRVCGCSEYDACSTPDGFCSWVEPDLCSACVGK